MILKWIKANKILNHQKIWGSYPGTNDYLQMSEFCYDTGCDDTQYLIKSTTGIFKQCNKTEKNCVRYFYLDLLFYKLRVFYLNDQQLKHITAIIYLCSDK